MKNKWNKIKNRFQRINPRVLIVQIIITLTYPAAKAMISSFNRLLIFTDAMTIIAFLLLIAGIFYSLYLHGDFDISGFLLRRSISRREAPKSFHAYMEDKKCEREDAFNYPLFLGIVYLLAAIFLAYTIL
ncbi:MAG: DUF3899 domain-containing protein [Oscillospiraceae bacterium]|jgi:hypothetical protein|nr:DUF3899 domain-containing protein [Oscillospiraceae bacterium]